MGLGGPNLVKGAVGQVVSAEALGGASLHTETSGVAHYKAKDDPDALAIIKTKLRELPATVSLPAPKGTAPAKPAEGLYDLLPADHRLPYDVEEVIARRSTRRKCCARTRGCKGV
jgi:3-methylcrotonyl-CoA carboxylase beta subunit